MAKVKVPVWGTVNKTIFFDPDAGARAEAAVEALAQAISEGVGGTILHSSLRNLQVGDDHPQYAMWQAPETITGQWNFQTIPFIQGETLAEYIEDVVGGDFFDFLQDTTSVVWTYHETANELEANVPPEFVQDTVGLMLTDTASIDLSYNDLAGTLQADVIFANPSGLIGLTAVNGVAGTPLRSDARHAIDQGIAPEWTATHGWADNVEIQMGAGNDLRLYHDGTNSIIRNDTGILRFMAGATVAVEQSTAGVWTFSEELIAPSGSAATPAYGFAGGGNGMYLSAANVVSLAAGGSQIFEFAANTSGVAMYAGSTAASISLAVYNLSASVNGLIVFADGRVRLPVGPLQIKDTITAPATQAGFAQIYVDTADGDLKVKFGDGTVKTIATNP
jgi:hypothetical protein